jgi:hypothetical protein
MVLDVAVKVLQLLIARTSVVEVPIQTASSEEGVSVLE